MTPDQLLSRVPLILSHLHPERTRNDAEQLGRGLKDEYCGRVAFFRELVKTINNAGLNGDVPMSYVNLGTVDHPNQRIGRVRTLANIQIQEFNPNRRDSSFSVVTSFVGQSRQYGTVPLGREVLGGAFTGMVNFEAPTFVINPNTVCADPWDIGVGVLLRYPLDHRWTMDTYRAIYDGLTPQLVRAAETQEMLLRAMQDERLNPGMADEARLLTLPTPQIPDLAA